MHFFLDRQKLTVICFPFPKGFLQKPLFRICPFVRGNGQLFSFSERKKVAKKKQTTLQVDGPVRVGMIHLESREALRKSLRERRTVCLPKPPAGFGRPRLFGG